MKQLKYLFLALLLTVSVFANDEIKLQYRFQPGKRYTMTSHTVWNFYGTSGQRVINKMSLDINADVIYREVMNQGQEALVEFRVTKNLLNGKKNPTGLPNDNITFRLKNDGTNDLSRYSGSPARAYFFYSFPAQPVAPGRDTWKNFYDFYSRDASVSIEMDVRFDKIMVLNGKRVALLKMNGKGSLDSRMTGGQPGIVKVSSEVYFDYHSGIMVRNVTRGILLTKQNEQTADFIATTHVN